MKGRAFGVVAALCVLVVGVWLVQRGGPAPGAQDEEPGAVRAPRSDGQRSPSQFGAPGGAAGAAAPRQDLGGGGGQPPGSPARAADPAPLAPEAADRSWDDDDSALDPADRTDADRTLVFAPDAAGIRGAVEESLPAIKECYASWLAAQPDLSGRLGVRFVIAPGDDDPAFATVLDVELVDSELGHVLVEGCVAGLFEELQFEAPGEPVTVNYPLQFQGDAPAPTR
jgi:hypothetical protein